MKISLITNMLERQALYNPQKTAIIEGSDEYSYSFIDAEANRIAQWLHASGINPGDRVALLGANTSQIVTALFGVLKAGAVFVPLHPLTATQKLRYIFEDCTPKAVIVDQSVLENHQFLIEDYSGLVLITQYNRTERQLKPSFLYWDALYLYPDIHLDVPVSEDDLASIIYTSGSTKDPKGVVEPHRQMVFATLAINSVIRNTEEDVILCGIPLSFDYGLYQIFLAFQVGAKLVLEREFAVPMTIPRLLKMHRITGFPGVPSLFAMLLRSKLLERVNLPDLRYITSTGDVFPSSHIQRLKEILPHTDVIPMYGLTECKRVSIMPKGELGAHPSSVGLPLPGTRVSIVDERGLSVPTGTTGQLIVNGPHVMSGYWNDPIETARRFRYDPTTGETWLYTGDYFCSDQDGFLFFIGRNEMLIKSLGQRISPAEIEAILCNLDGVAEAAAVGVQDTVLGESISVFISVTKADAINSQDIAEYCKSELSPVERPRDIFILEAPLPRTNNGKIDRLMLKEMATNNIRGNGQ